MESASSPRGPVRLLRECASYRWALHRVFEHLVSADAVRLVIAALEYGDGRYEELTHWLLDGDAPCPRLYVWECLDNAVVLNCWKAAEVLSLRARRFARRPFHWRTHRAVVPQADSPLRRVMIAVTQSRFSFSMCTIGAVAARGDLEAVRSMLAHHSLLRHDPEVGREIFNCYEMKKTAFDAACNSHQRHVIDWLITHARITDRCDKKRCGLAMSCLVDEFASYGYLDMLKTLRARDENESWWVNSAIMGAAENGHVDVVEWFHRSFRRSIDPALFKAAARQGQLEVLEWLWQHRRMRNTHVNFLESAAECGRVDVLRWLRLNLTRKSWKRHVSSALVAAGRASAFEVVRFLHEECAVKLEVSLLDTMNKTTSVEYVAYVLDRVCPSEVNAAKAVKTAAAGSNVEIVRYLTLQRGMWSRDAFALSHDLPICQFLYAHGKERACALNTSLETQIDFSKISILAFAVRANFSTGRWLAESVREVETGTTLASSEMCNDMQFPSSPSAQAFILACLHARPTQCLELAWLPVWAVRANSFAVFSKLFDVGHPKVASSVLYAVITSDSVRDSRFILKLLATHASKVLPCVVPWAAGIGSDQVLALINNRCSDVLLNLKQTEKLEIAFQAVKHGHAHVLPWLQDHALLIPREATLEARCQAFWAVTKLMQEAVKHDRSECLRWIVETLTVHTNVARYSLLSAVKLRSARVARWFTRRFQPSDLALSNHDVRVIRKFLEGSPELPY